MDFACRQKTPGTHVNVTICRQLPLPDLADDGPMFGGTGDGWLFFRVLELTYTAWDLETFARDVGYDGPPFRWDPERRFLLRCELDAAFFHLYGLSHDDTDYVMDTFPIVRKNDEKAHGESRTGTPYQTRLDPPPADPRVAHPDARAEKKGAR